MPNEGLTFATSNTPNIGFLQAVPSQPQQAVSIQKVTNGFVIQVGCQTFVALDWKDVSEGVELYFADQKAAMDKYLPKEKKA